MEKRLKMLLQMLPRDKLTLNDGVSKLQLMQELFGMSREELLNELSKKTGDE